MDQLTYTVRRSKHHSTVPGQTGVNTYGAFTFPQLPCPARFSV